MLKGFSNLYMASKLRKTFIAASAVVQPFLKVNHVKTIYDTKVFNRNLDPKTTALEDFVKTYFKVSKICTSKTPGGTKACTASSYKGLVSGKAFGNFDGDVCAILNNKTTLCFNRISSKKEFAKLYMDLNGPQGPNIWGRDAYRFRYDSNGKLAEMYSENKDVDLYEYCGQDDYGTGCFRKMEVEAWSMNY